VHQALSGTEPKYYSNSKKRQIKMAKTKARTKKTRCKKCCRIIDQVDEDDLEYLSRDYFSGRNRSIKS
jgi:hypothetical protein